MSLDLVTICEHTFFANGLDEHAVVVDAGANIGEFSRQCNSRFGCVPYALEPNPTSAAQISTAQVFPYALSSSSGQVKLFVGPNPEACSIFPLPEHANTVTARSIALSDFLSEQRLTRIDLLKLDIEGAELDVLASLTGSDVIRQITVEFHDFMFPDQREHVIQSIRHMHNLGFRCFNFSSPGHGDVLFVNPRFRLPFASALRGYARIIARSCKRQMS